MLLGRQKKKPREEEEFLGIRDAPASYSTAPCGIIGHAGILHRTCVFTWNFRRNVVGGLEAIKA